MQLFQDNSDLIINNMWTFMVFALIVACFTVFICKRYYEKKLRHERKRLNLRVEELVAEKDELSSMIIRYAKKKDVLP